jgi:methyl-accepting chemotaxis protein
MIEVRGSQGEHMADATRSGHEAIDRRRIIRKRYLIDPKRQLRAVVMTTSVVALLVVLVNVGFALVRASQSSYLSAVAPQLGPVLERQNTTYSWLMLMLSAALLVLVSGKTIVETHRTAGAVFAVRQRLERIRQGDLHVTLKLRRNDNLQDLEQPFDEMVAALRDRALEEASKLEELAAAAASLGPESEGIARSLGELALAKRRLGA